MKYSNLVTKTKKKLKKTGSKNAYLLQKAGYVNQLMSGVYTLLPLGIRVIRKIEKIVREEMNKIGQEILMPSLAPIENWQKTERFNNVDVLFKASAANSKSQEKNSSEYILSATHEEVVTPLMQNFIKSYRDLPASVYQIQNKFRNEERPKSGLMRMREFLMKDLYSFHESEEDLNDYYFNKAIPTYQKVYEKLGIGDITIIAKAPGGDFTNNYSHEFQTLCNSGEDTLYYLEEDDSYYNSETYTDAAKHEKLKSCEVGNIFRLNTKYSEKFNLTYIDKKNNQRLVYMGCYGMGIQRLIGVIADIFNDERGLIWPKHISPYTVHLISIGETKTYKISEQMYIDLRKAGIEVFWDDRSDINAGEKFADADLLGIPYQLIIGDNYKENKRFEVKKRKNGNITNLEKNELIKLLKTK